MITESSASRRSLVLLTAGVLGCALIGLGAGTAVAQVPLLWAPRVFLLRTGGQPR